MSGTNRKTNMTATVAGSLARNKDRRYLLVVAQTDLVITISGGASFTLPAGQAWEPDLAPQNDILFSGTGTVVEG